MDSRYRRFAKRFLSRPDAKSWVIGSGNPEANVILLGFRPDPAEKQAFTGEKSKLLRDLLHRMNVPLENVWLTYAVKHMQKPDPLQWDDVQPWLHVINTEIEICRPRAVVLLGVEVAWMLLGLETENVETLRKTRYIPSRVPTNFFVTYSPHDVARCGGFSSELIKNWEADLAAVFNAQVSYFAKQDLKDE